MFKKLLSIMLALVLICISALAMPVSAESSERNTDDFSNTILEKLPDEKLQQLETIKEEIIKKLTKEERSKNYQLFACKTDLGKVEIVLRSVEENAETFPKSGDIESSLVNVNTLVPLTEINGSYVNALTAIYDSGEYINDWNLYSFQFREYGVVIGVKLAAYRYNKAGYQPAFRPVSLALMGIYNSNVSISTVTGKYLCVGELHSFPENYMNSSTLLDSDTSYVITNTQSHPVNNQAYTVTNSMAFNRCILRANANYNNYIRLSGSLSNGTIIDWYNIQMF